jgi:hypothetical protein
MSVHVVRGTTPLVARGAGPVVADADSDPPLTLRAARDRWREAESRLGLHASGTPERSRVEAEVVRRHAEYLELVSVERDRIAALADRVARPRRRPVSTPWTAPPGPATRKPATTG